MLLRARYLAPLLCGLAIIPLTLWYDAHRSAAERRERWRQRGAVERTAERLNRPIETPPGVKSLVALKAVIEGQTALQVHFDDDLPEWDARAPAWPIEVPSGRFPLRTVLNTALSQVELTYDVETGGLIITHEDVSQDSNQRYVEVYPLPMPELAPKDINEESWADLIVSVTGYQNWGQAGGTGSHVEAVPGALVVLQTPCMHREIRRLFDNLQRLRTPPTDLTPVPFWPASDQELNARILAALAEPSSIDWTEKPLDEAFQQLAARHQIPLLIRFHKLEEAAIERTTPITKRIQEVSLRSILQLTLRELELTYVLDDGALVITTPDDAWNDQLLVAYPVHDLVGPGIQGDYDPLIELIATTIAPTSWDEVGGPSSLRGGPDGWLLVSQSLDVHEQIEFVLAQLRKALSYDESTPVLSLTKANAKEQKILEKLDQEILLVYDDMPLRDAMRLLSDALEVPIVINEKKLEEAAVPLDVPVRMNLPPRTFRQQLRTLLSEIDLTYLIDDEVLQITTPDDANSPDRLEARLYDIRLLTDPDFGALSADLLEETVTTVIAPQTWDEIGGPGSLTVYDDLLVVGQERDCHEEVERFLAALEAHCLPMRGERRERPWVVDPAATERTRALERRLQEPIDFAVENVGLVAALEKLAAEQKLPLIVVRVQLEYVGIGEQTPIRFSARDMTLGGVLDRLLEPFQLGYVVRDDALEVTSFDDADGHLAVRLYREVPGPDKLASAGISVQFYQMLGELPFVANVRALERINDEWTVALASDSTHRRLADQLLLKRTGKLLQWAVERKALDEERKATGDWDRIVPGQKITAAQRLSGQPARSSDKAAE